MELSQLELILVSLLAICLTLMVLARAATSRARTRVAALERMTEELRAGGVKRAELEQERRLVRLFLREFPLFMRELHGKKKVREIPDAMISFVMRIFEPRGAVVLMRRSPARSDPDKGNHLIAAASDGVALPRGTVLRSDSGMLERVFESARTLDRREFEQSVLKTAGDRAVQTGFDADLASPIWIDGESLGVLALSQPTKNRSDSRYVLELIAQTGAVALNNARAFNQIRSAADIDALTGVLNKGAMTHLLERSTERAREEKSSLSIFLFDIDNFKNYNAINGHVAGDELLRLLPRLVAESVRSDDTFGRYGGEEFLLILPDRAPDEAMHVAQKLRGLIEAQDFPFGDKQPLGRITVSGGVATAPDHGRSAVDLLRAADAALYEAKQAGRNRVLCAEDPRQGSYEEVPPAVPGETERDDLKRIQGIGPAFEKRLNDLGYFSYRQIADLNWPQMIMLADELKTYPERIVRDGWMKQARELHAEKYGGESTGRAAAGSAAGG